MGARKRACRVGVSSEDRALGADVLQAHLGTCWKRQHSPGQNGDSRGTELGGGISLRASRAWERPP